MEDENKDRDNHQSKQKVFHIIRDIIFIVASVFGVIAFFRTCTHDNKLNDINYELTSIGHQPILKLAGIPDISSTAIDMLSVKIRKQPNINSRTFNAHVSFIIMIKAKIKITNVSENSIGKIKLLLTTDKIQRVKEFIMGKYFPDNMETDFHKWPELENSHVLPRDTIELSTSTYIRSDSDEKYVMHFLIVYLNDLGQLYHTHAKVPFEFKQPPLTQIKHKMTVKKAEKMMYDKAERLLMTNELMKPLNPVSFYETYNSREAELAMKNLKEIIQKLSDN